MLWVPRGTRIIGSSRDSYLGGKDQPGTKWHGNFGRESMSTPSFHTGKVDKGFLCPVSEQREEENITQELTC